jgi:6-phosphogluconolactonase (cycloisomerase 2 family)
MKRAIILLFMLSASALGAVVSAEAASGDSGLVFVQTNEPGGNRVVVFRRADDGRLSQLQSFATGGNGGVAAPGTESDHLASQGSLVYDAAHSLLFAVNAGSDSVSVFRVDGSTLELRDVEPSGGEFPASVAVAGNLLYVLNAGGSGVLRGFRITGAGTIHPIPGSERSLGLANTDPPNFLTSPGQVGFSPDGRQLLVTTKASQSTIDVFAVQPNGRLSDAPVTNPSATPVPFAFTFDPAQRLVSGEAGASSVTTYRLQGDGTLAGPQSLSDNQAALCWITRVGGFYYVSNTGSNTVSGYRIDAGGAPSLVTPTGVVATTDAGPIDSATPSDAAFLYVQTGLGGSVHEYHVNADGTLTELGKVTGLPAGMEGIAAT